MYGRRSSRIFSAAGASQISVRHKASVWAANSCTAAAVSRDHPLTFQVVAIIGWCPLGSVRVGCLPGSLDYSSWNRSQEVLPKGSHKEGGFGSGMWGGGEGGVAVLAVCHEEEGGRGEDKVFPISVLVLPEGDEDEKALAGWDAVVVIAVEG